MVLTYVLAVLVLIAMPGPDQALITRSAMAGGRAGGLLTMVGGAAGLVVHASAAAAGLSALLVASAEAFTAVKIVGVVYLVWIAVQTLRTTRRVGDEPAGAAPVHRVRYVRIGFLSNVLNPKVALFFLSFMPQFMDSSAPASGEAVLLSAIFAAIYVGWFTLYVWVVDCFSAVLAKAAVKAWVARVTGCALLGFAARLATAPAH